jgi:hypothetical protein
METLRRTACAWNRFAGASGKAYQPEDRRRGRRARTEPASPDLVRAGLDATFIEHGRRMPRRCGRTGFGSSCRTRLWSHLFTLSTVAVLEETG